MKMRIPLQRSGSVFRRPGRAELDFSPRSRRAKIIALCIAAVLAVLALGSSSASAETGKPWWHLSYSARPSTLQREGEGKNQVVLNAVNVGDAQVDGRSSPVKIEVRLPPGLKAVSLEAEAGNADTSIDDSNRGPVQCPTAKELKEGASLTCSFSHGKGVLSSEGILPAYDVIEVTIGVEAADAVSGEEVQATVSGGGAASASTHWAITAGDEGEAAIPFGLQDNELALEGTSGAPSGEPDTLAGSHPFQLTDTIVLNQLFQQSDKEQTLSDPVALPKDIGVKLPAGLVGNPTPLARCSVGQFLTRVPNGPEFADACPTASVVGIASVLINEPTFGLIRFTVPLFNLEPRFGEPARFGFYIPVTETPVYIDSSVRGGPGTGEEYAIDGVAENLPEIDGLLSSELVFWGVPSNPVHNNSRGWGCISAAREEPHALPCESVENLHPPAFFTMPTSCSGVPLESSAEIDSWPAANKRKAEGLPPLLEPVEQTKGYQMQTLDGCNQLKFGPTMQAEPTTDSASSASGLKFNLDFHDEGLTSEEGDAQSQMNKTVVALPAGFTIDPSAGVGLAGCTTEEYEKKETIESAPGAGCPSESKLGTVEVQTPLLTQTLEGNIFIAQPYENPFSSLVALYIVIKNPETGLMVKLAGKVTPCLSAGEAIAGKVCEAAGQLFTTVENVPQFPISHFSFKFREGQQAPLITPATCNTYTTEALLSPWSDPLTPQLFTSSFQITSGAGGGACPAGGAPPFNPGIEAGTVNNNAGAFTPFYLHLTRSDSDQEISGFTTSMPPGLSGDLAGLPFCPEAAIQTARDRTGPHGGSEEEANPICPQSEIGHTLVGTGVGGTLAYVPGKLYWAGPFQGAPFSLVSVTSAKVGPFDLGTVVLRFGLNLNPYTTQISISPSSSEPIPYIIKGIVTHVRDIRVYADRSHFIINPTSCAPAAISSTLTANEGASKTVSSPFQAASCANLKFAPKLSASTQGKTSKAKGASLTVKVVEPNEPQGSQSWISTTKVELPKALPSRLTTLQKACTAKQFEANPAACPSASMIGYAKVTTPILPVPLEGPAIFVSHGGEAFPSLEFVLQGYGVKVILVGSTFISKSGVTSSTFNKTIDDQPFSTFELTLPEGPYSALAANGNLCALTTTKTVSKKVKVKVKGREKTVTRKVKQTTPASLQMPTELVGWNGATIHQTTPIAVTGCPKAVKATKHKAKKKMGKGSSGRGHK